MKSAKIVSIENYRQDSDFTGSEGSTAGHAVVLDFSSRGKEIAERKRVTQRAAERSILLLEVVAELARDYESQMLCIANQYSREEWQEKHNTDPYAQIEFDMKRLGNMMQALQFAMAERGARSLREAAEMILSWPDDEVRSTLEYLLASDYFGFVAISRVLRCAGFEDNRYVENLNDLYALLKELQEKGFVYCINAFSALFLNEAVAV